MIENTKELRMERIRSGMYGLVTADAVGVPAEFRSRESLRAAPVTGMTGGGAHGQPAGTWSDDSSLALCLAFSLGRSEGVHTNDLMQRFASWFNAGCYTPWGDCFDYGGTTARAIQRYHQGTPPALCGGKQDSDNGNGSLMRILPLAYALYARWGSDPAGSGRAMGLIHKVSGLTHRHPLAQSACGIYVNIACRLLGGLTLRRAIEEGVAASLAWYGRHDRFRPILSHWDRLAALDDLPEDRLRSGGYVVDTLEAALWCLLHTDGYAACVLRAVNLGRDTDTTAAVAGGLAGLAYGYAAIPADWLDVLAGQGLIDEGCACLLHTWEVFLPPAPAKKAAQPAPAPAPAPPDAGRQARAACALDAGLPAVRADGRRKVVVLGGSFHPPTLAHRCLLTAAIEAVGADTGIFVPAPQDYVVRKLAHTEPDSKVLTAAQRVTLLHDLCAGDTRLRVDEREIGQDRRAGNYQTLRAIAAQEGDAALFCLIGCDKLSQISRWRSARALLDEFRVLVAARDGEDPALVIAANPFLFARRHAFLSFPAPEAIRTASSSAVRRLLRAHSETARDWLSGPMWAHLTDFGYIDWERIDRFRDEFEFLSNFYPAAIEYDGLLYCNAEAAFQAQKCADRADRRQFFDLSAGKAKRLGRHVALRPDWEQVKDGLMLDIVRAKFTQNWWLGMRLVATGSKTLVEGNTWGDTYWGVDARTGQGENRLGRILMQVREEIIERH